ncbi:hypothetical protein [Deinococcus humi]|uniref:Uncharacterized protein n=1 Tax=Deinococcus humi TaxID=662880 RepID=A0A7W8JWH9_9DEIO|nr:hypothetical protein [Deinococcus humi]MBB5364521.1 hypothetical protein [Deinococcus humi]
MTDALASLVKQGKKPSVQAIHLETRLLDPGGIGIHPTTFRRNPEVAEIVSAALGKPSKVEQHLDFSCVLISDLRPRRHTRQAFHRLLSKSKRDLAMRVFVLEEHVRELRAQLATRDLEEIERLERQLRDSGKIG